MRKIKREFIEEGGVVVWKYRASASTRASHQGRSRGSRVT